MFFPWNERNATGSSEAVVPSLHLIIPAALDHNANMKRIFAGVFLVPWLVLAGVQPCKATIAPVQLDFFFEAGCVECEAVRHQTLPELEQQCGGLYELHEHDTAIESNYLALAAWMKQLDIKKNARTYMIVSGREALCGADEITAKLVPAVLAHALAQSEAPITPPQPGNAQILHDRLTEFTWVGVTLFGLMDGINPCAITTLIFLISVLTMGQIRGRQLMTIGLTFCLAAFLTYTLIGLGLLQTLRALHGIRYLRNILDIALLIILLVLAGFSFADAIRFRRRPVAESVTLQLPDHLKARVHRLLREKLSKSATLTAVFGLGALVTGIESVCTGQVYVPTLALIVKTQPHALQAWGYLLLYNAMFVMPLVAILVLTRTGLGMARLINWGQKEVVIGKVLLGLLFLFMAAIVIVTR